MQPEEHQSKLKIKLKRFINDCNLFQIIIQFNNDLWKVISCVKMQIKSTLVWILNQAIWNFKSAPKIS